MVKSIALLACDTLIPAVVSAHGDYHALLTTLLSASLPAGSDPHSAFVLDSYDVVHKQEYPPDEDKYDGMIISGSGV
jgi:hypothetical protein